MDKAEEKALEVYPKISRVSEPHGVIPADSESHYLGDANAERREGFVVGYNQATEEVLEAIKTHLLNHGYMELWEFEAMLSFTKIK